MSLNVTTGHITRTTPSTTTLEKDSSSRSQVDHRDTDDPEEESPQSDDETAEELRRLCDAEA